ncbi:MAG: WD40 repeat domain-containing protein [Gemmataceae bacterium]|nr:WD40 repeat domain-containing protein [Gemmataceae bacterium]
MNDERKNGARGGSCVHRSSFLVHRLLLVLVGGAALTGAQPPAPRSPVPDSAAQARAEQTIRRVLADDFARATDPAARGKLIHTLLTQGRETRDDPALRFVLLRQARDLAARAGDARTALTITSELACAFAVDEAQHKVEALLLTALAARTAEQRRALTAQAITLLEELIRTERFDAAIRLAPLAESAEDDALRARVQEAQFLLTEQARVRPAVERLKAKPGDPQANLEVGRYQALLRGDWERGLPLLARGADSELKALALRDLARPAEGPAQLGLAQGWRRLVKGAAERSQGRLLLRAGHWYQQAALRLQGEQRERAEKQLAQVVAQLPPGWRLPGYYALVGRLEGHQGNVTSLAFAPDGRRLLTASADRTLRLWEVPGGSERKRFPAHSDWVRCVAFAADGRRALSCGDDDTIRLWDVTSARELRRLSGHGEWVRAVALLPDGRRVASAGDDESVRLWDLESGKELKKFAGHKGHVFGVAVSPDGRRLLSCGSDESVRLWDVESGKELRRLEGHSGNVQAVAFAPDGRLAASAGADGVVRLWDVERGQEVRRLMGHKGSVWCVAFSPDGRLVLSGGADGTARLWETASGQELSRLSGHTGLVLSVAFAPGGLHVATGSADKTARLWSATPR